MTAPKPPTTDQQHEPVKMAQDIRIARMTEPTRGYKNGKRVWITPYVCMTCLARKNAPTNSMRGWELWCDGKGQHKKRRATLPNLRRCDGLTTVGQ